jgi:formylmethanofuran dehydrogenase subunit E
MNDKECRACEQYAPSEYVCDECGEARATEHIHEKDLYLCAPCARDYTEAS